MTNYEALLLAIYNSSATKEEKTEMVKRLSDLIFDVERKYNQ